MKVQAYISGQGSIEFPSGDAATVRAQAADYLEIAVAQIKNYRVPYLAVSVVAMLNSIVGNAVQAEIEERIADEAKREEAERARAAAAASTSAPSGA